MIARLCALVLVTLSAIPFTEPFAAAHLLGGSATSMSGRACLGTETCSCHDGAAMTARPLIRVEQPAVTVSVSQRVLDLQLAALSLVVLDQPADASSPPRTSVLRV